MEWEKAKGCLSQLALWSANRLETGWAAVSAAAQALAVPMVLAWQQSGGKGCGEGKVLYSGREHFSCNGMFRICKTEGFSDFFFFFFCGFQHFFPEEGFELRRVLVWECKFKCLPCLIHIWSQVSILSQADLSITARQCSSMEQHRHASAPSYFLCSALSLGDNINMLCSWWGTKFSCFLLLFPLLGPQKVYSGNHKMKTTVSRANSQAYNKLFCFIFCLLPLPHPAESTLKQ